MYPGSKYPRVPCTIVAICIWSSGTNLGVPKSEIYAMKSWLSNMFVDLISLWIIGTEAVECKFDNASAVSIAILRWVSHDTVDALLSW